MTDSTDTDRIAEVQAALKPSYALALNNLVVDAQQDNHPLADAVGSTGPYVVHGCVVYDAQKLRAAIRTVWREAPALLSLVEQLQGQLDTAREETADMRAALERRLLQVKSFRSEGHKRVNPMLCTTPVTTVEDDIEDARLWWQAVKDRTETRESNA